MENWQRVDDEHSHCAQCSGVFRNIELDDGQCTDCLERSNRKHAAVIQRANAKTVSKAVKASTQFLASMEQQGKSGKSMPLVFDSFWKELGGEEEYGARMAQEFLKAHGEGLTAAELESWSPSQKIKLQWYELVNRHVGRSDESKTLDIGSLEESDLEAILADLGRTAVIDDKEIRRLALLSAIERDPEFRKIALEKILQEDPSLESAILEKHGVTTIDAKKVEPKGNKRVEDYSPEDEEYRE